MIIKSKCFSITILVFSLILIQSIGIRFFSGQGTFLSIIIILLSFKNFNDINIKDIRFLLLAFLFILSSKVINQSYSYSSFFYQVLLIISTYLFLIGYRKKIDLLQKDFFLALQIFVWHGLIGCFFSFLFPNQFVQFNGLNKTLYYVFYISTSTFGNIQRNTGIFWEPGVFQLVANLYLFYCIKFHKSNRVIFFAVVAVVSSFSTSGLVLLSISALYFLYKKWKSKKITISTIILLLFGSLALVPVVNSNIKDKVNDENTSGLVRLRDFNIGIELIKEKPILGHGIFDSDYLITKRYVKIWESNIFSTEYQEISDEMSGGYTNGLLGLIAWYGIPTSFLIYFFYFKNKFIDDDFIERSLFNLILLISLISEPISYTSLFLMFPFSYWIINKKKKINRRQQKHQINNLIPNNNLI